MKSFLQFITESQFGDFWIVDGNPVNVRPHGGHVDYLHTFKDELGMPNINKIPYMTQQYDAAIKHGLIRVSWAKVPGELYVDAMTIDQVRNIPKLYSKMGISKVNSVTVSIGGVNNVVIASRNTSKLDFLLTGIQEAFDARLGGRSSSGSKSYWIKGDRVIYCGDNVSHDMYIERFHNEIGLDLKDAGEYETYTTYAVRHGWLRVFWVPGSRSIAFSVASPADVKKITAYYGKMKIGSVATAYGNIGTDDDALKYVKSQTDRVAAQLVTESASKHHIGMTTSDANMILLQAMSRYQAKKIRENNNEIVYECPDAEKANHFADVWMQYRALFPFMVDLTVDGTTVRVEK